MATRLDVWLWSVRLFKTRSAANKAVNGGHVRLNDVPVKPAHTVVPGDVVTVREPGWTRRYEVTQLINKRVGAPIAQRCYVDQSPPRPEYLAAGAVARRDRGAGRPTKRDRREIDRLTGRPHDRRGRHDEPAPWPGDGPAVWGSGDGPAPWGPDDEGDLG